MREYFGTEVEFWGKRVSGC
uniref:Uncharacterized protein n=1 Tax=Anguilla anguilla TaxID=7936 RepID=A0A0E9ULM1_ANGAN